MVHLSIGAAERSGGMPHRPPIQLHIHVALDVLQHMLSLGLRAQQACADRCMPALHAGGDMPSRQDQRCCVVTDDHCPFKPCWRRWTV